LSFRQQLQYVDEVFADRSFGSGDAFVLRCVVVLGVFGFQRSMVDDRRKSQRLKRDFELSCFLPAVPQHISGDVFSDSEKPDSQGCSRGVIADSVLPHSVEGDSEDVLEVGVCQRAEKLSAE